MTVWRKGMNVFLKRRGYGDRSETVDYNHKYNIRSIGKKQAIIDMIYTPKEIQTYGSYRRQGQTFRINTKEEIEAWRDNHPHEILPYWLHESWSEYFVAAGDSDWDANENYHWS